MRKQLSITIIMLLLCQSIFTQTVYRAMFYNVENLFDTVNDSIKNDDDFMPDGFMRWNMRRYWDKLRNITRVITAVGEMHSPSLVGLCEIENDTVLHDLTKRSPLRAQGYEYVATNSPDERGIDVALLYQPHQFGLLESNEYEIEFSRSDARPSRNILHAVGKVISGDTLDVFVVHPPSRYGGQKESEPQRLDVAKQLRNRVDSLWDVRTSCNVIILGDFNDYPNNKSLKSVLKASSIQSDIADEELYNMFLHRMNEKDFGTYFYQGMWGILDQIIVSGNMLRDDSAIYVKNKEAHIFKADFLLEEDKNTGSSKPYRTYLGPRYLGGFSDHLPVYVDFIIQ